MKKIVLYTAIMGKTGRFLVPKISDKSVDRICFTDLNLKSHFYEIRKTRVKDRVSVRRQRFVKIIIPDEIFYGYEYSVYVDCKRPYSINFDYLLKHLQPGSDFLTRRHNRRSCLYDEGEFCIKKKKDSEETIRKQLDFYKSEGCPAHCGLHASGLLLRRHTKQMKEFSLLWWKQVKAYSYRDQISLPYVAWKTGTKISVCGRGV